ncbi:hypothetical protein CLV56_0483 [Mumia flava]|uniref:Uncharacterized protein n=1 Tax=Mumia flava TaxID=1348852 RepID=A0A0B2BLG7_9ACTN|nr:hypothetical protein [Mumia flava]PJJ56278.1 hypothetical protein CLV56_0483 [Mumia flava]
MTSRPHAPYGVGRRRLLLGAAASATLVATAACDWALPPKDPERDDHPDADLLASALADEEQVLATATAVRTADGAQAQAAAGVAQRCQERVDVLAAAVGTGASPSASASAPTVTQSSGSEPSASRTTGAAPTLRRLARESRRTRDARSAAALEAADGQVARLLACVAAGHAQDALVLRDTLGAR